MIYLNKSKKFFDVFWSIHLTFCRAEKMNKGIQFNSPNPFLIPHLVKGNFYDIMEIFHHLSWFKTVFLLTQMSQEPPFEVV